MREAVVVSYARTGLAKSGRGGFNMTPAMTMAAHAIKHAVAKSGVEPEAVEDVYLGNGAHGAGNLARLSGLLAGLPTTTAGSTVQRHCSSGLNAIASAANYIKQDGADVVVAGGVESISMPNPGFGGPANMDPTLEEMYPAIYMAMIETADIVASATASAVSTRTSTRCSRSSGWRRPRSTGCSPRRSCRWRRR